MSFILQALERAEHERRMGKPPGLEPASGPLGQVAARRWPWLVAGGVVAVNAAVLGVVALWPEEGLDRNGAARVAGAPAPAAVAIAPSTPEPRPSPVMNPSGSIGPESIMPDPVSGPPRRAELAPALVRPLVEEATTATQALVIATVNEATRVASAPAPAPVMSVSPPAERKPSSVTAVRLASGEEMVVPDPVIGRTSSADPATAAVRSMVEETAATMQAPVITTENDIAMPNADRGADAVRSEVIEPILERPEPTAPAVPPVAAAPIVVIDQTIPRVAELPPAVRRRLPELQVNVHVYAEEPKRRFVLINMRKYREGDRIGHDGPLVDRITPAAVIIDYGSGLARL